jgi:hypothetical protein
MRGFLLVPEKEAKSVCSASQKHQEDIKSPGQGFASFVSGLNYINKSENREKAENVNESWLRVCGWESDAGGQI